MRPESIISHITPVGGNIFADLGFSPKEAARLLSESGAVITQKLALRAALIAELVTWMEAEQLTPAEAATRLGQSTSCIAELIGGQSSTFNIDGLVSLLLRAGKQVQISVR